MSLDQLQAGMILAENVHNREGQVLLRAGATLTDKHVRLFRIWGVRQVDIAGGAGESPQQIEADLRLNPELTRANDRVDERFRYVQQIPLMMEIKEEVKRFLHLQIGGGDAPG